jgi:hypothetical protein
MTKSINRETLQICRERNSVDVVQYVYNFQVHNLIVLYAYAIRPYAFPKEGLVFHLGSLILYTSHIFSIPRPCIHACPIKIFNHRKNFHEKFYEISIYSCLLITFRL